MHGRSEVKTAEKVKVVFVEIQRELQHPPPIKNFEVQRFFSDLVVFLVQKSPFEGAFTVLELI